MKKYGNMEVRGSELHIGGCSTLDLAKEFSTPLFIVDEENLERTLKTFKENFVSKKFETNTIYASKALTGLYLLDIVKESGFHLDVVSGGELFAGLEAGFDPKKIYFHGNNKSKEEIDFAIDSGVGKIVIDSILEGEYLIDLAEKRDYMPKILIRINPGIEAHTHEYIQTSRSDSKFGLPIGSKETMDLIKALSNSSLSFYGIHCHIGSQVFDSESFFKEQEIMIEFASKIEKELEVNVKEINLGGGFGVYYTEGDKPLEMDKFLKDYISKIENSLEAYALSPKRISIEPGRSLINNSASTLYTLGWLKETDEGLPYAFIDGGMADNPRPSLYQADYNAFLANKMDQDPNTSYRIGGKCCESGDILIKEARLPRAETGDLLLVPATGAYTISMASNYNMLRRPATVFVKDGKASLAVKRETYEDLIKNHITRR